jgi:hypothetical protein
MKSNLYLVVPAVVTVLNLCFALYIVHVHHHDGVGKLDAVELSCPTQHQQYHQYQAPSQIMYTDAPAPSIATTSQKQQHISPTKWTLMRSSLAHK